jgi:putative transposase
VILPVDGKRAMIEMSHPFLSIAEQCKALGLARSTFYYSPGEESPENLTIMRRMDEIYLNQPFYGYRRITAQLQREGHAVNEKRIRRLMQTMGLSAIYPKPNLSRMKEGKIKYPYLLRGITIECCNHVWSTDITYIPMKRGFLYLVAIMDWFSRYVLSWGLSTTLDEIFCLDALEVALMIGRPKIFNSDQGSQFTGSRFTSALVACGISISWDGKGRALDNVFIERLWRSLKYEEVYPKSYESVQEASKGISRYIKFYNKERPHQSLGYKTPFEIYCGGKNKVIAMN